MRIKLLIFPAVLAASIVIIIAYIWPEFGTLRQSFKSLDQSNGVLSSIMQKNANIKSLTNGLDQNTDKESFVKSYLPTEKNEEKIINGINYLAANAGVSLVNIAMEKEQVQTPVAPAQTQEPTGSKDVLFSGAKDANGNSTGATQSREVKTVKIKTDVIGNYENIKSFLEQVYAMEMFSSLDSIIISKEAKTGNGGQANTDPSMLNSTLEINFGYLPELRIYNKNYSDPIFSQTSLDLTTYGRLTSLVSKKIPAIEVSTEGRTNPFLP
jgi:Tfp pilus assembly protein PilO